ncbi:cAMP-binding domain of CRP or a regulatory subunit of cAMP-dependent protein kinases [Chitinophaga costaii]|uniref:cAMP-binding domain of CRP or a regulatory subunit of cAMP-dependent protein kinases n=1 Tax=Chitinophaga costaii TaxID=1335309 RepID=A0A1C4E3E8_9BACT|nr:Crp/Fnr family transcriptional regulator [Chitinophaga costaii]PUZ24345.1 Crp/Fnr family transcriptional regulator [Chitinophaga costaii]SCC38114.1 cAMP-binding domain of CRP or a regulatory subunit of cAMP-dependent protein kinases [Chitinophaga costaii]
MKKLKQGCDLATCFLCKRCLPEWLPAVNANREHLLYKKGAALFREGDPVTGIYFVYSGTVKVHKKWGEEKELIVRFAAAGDIVGHRGIGSEQYYPITATALEPVSVCFISLDFFNSSLRVNHQLLYELMMFYASELQLSEKQMRNLAHMPVKGRVANALLLLQEKFGTTPAGNIGLSLSRQDLAAYAGTTYETVFRLLTELSGEGIIRHTGRDIQILDAAQLAGFTRATQG